MWLLLAALVGDWVVLFKMLILVILSQASSGSFIYFQF